MVSRKVKVVNPTGLHLRPAGVLSSTALRFQCRIELRTKNQFIDAKSVLNIMGAGIRKGTELEVVCDGTDEEKALETIVGVIASGLGEKPEEEPSEGPETE